jgi:hypothetical protein
MDYNKKYLKYKYKYLLKQNGSGSDNYKLLDPSVLEYITTDETPEERNDRIRSNILPRNNYGIMTSVNEILNTYNLTQIKKYDISKFNTIISNVNNLFNELFELINSCRNSNLCYIIARGDGNCFLNSLYIYTITTGKSDLGDFNDFKNIIELMGDEYLDSQNYDKETLKMLKSEMRDPNVPDVNALGHGYANYFNVNIMVIQTNTTFQSPRISTVIKPNNPNINTDHIIIIQNQNCHFNLLIPLSNDNEIAFHMRKTLFKILKLRYKIN